MSVYLKAAYNVSKSLIGVTATGISKISKTGKFLNRHRTATALVLALAAAGVLGYYAHPCFNPQQICNASCQLIEKPTGLFGLGSKEYTAKLINDCTTTPTICQTALSSAVNTIKQSGAVLKAVLTAVGAFALARRLAPQ